MGKAERAALIGRTAAATVLAGFRGRFRVRITKPAQDTTRAEVAETLCLEISDAGNSLKTSRWSGSERFIQEILGKEHA
ncbi:MAG: hypothetical protein NTW87_34915 [Planctomycetota bacterium]|nr:hypothetical protein [Planctomycetota bacterium]